MKQFNKDQLIANLKFTAMHVSKVNGLLAKYHRIHRIPFHSLTAILATLILLLLFWAVGLTNVVHTVADRIGTSIVSIEAKEMQQKDDDVLSSKEEAGAGEEVSDEEPKIHLNMIADVFSSQLKYSTSGVIKYAIIVALFDTIVIVGLAIGMTYGLFYLYHLFQVERNKDKLKRLVLDIENELNELEESIIPQEYWHIPYLQRMINYVEHDRVDTLRECLSLMDLEIRHKQIVDALVQDQPIDPIMLTEAISSTPAAKKSVDAVKPPNLSIK